MNASSNPSGHNRMLTVAEVCGDDADVLALSVARFVASGYMTSDVACWDAAFDGAERLLGCSEGGRLVSGMVGIMRTLRAEREGDWQFMPATCCRVTAHECALVALIGRGRRRLWDEVGRDAAAITGRTEAPRLVAAVRDAVETINAAARQLGEARPSGTALH
ncbi:hypothetical protein [Methylobacterium soli]|uniref:Uncharacterized protein n=1 Tax=Methylobacterium soli TaxID=553447 RepID=A0A6L3T499_9HYPH|nr:hypothetical protein [Methylobacterium soli]KAB1081756.1 hypothetical protein F6X53_01265 [Methylobacterium soli]GJE43181.1 hypothetical protein AEGHOMDF_2360 [Methylobacterium soli]